MVALVFTYILVASFFGIAQLGSFFVKGGYKISSTIYFYSDGFSVNKEADVAIQVELNSTYTNVLGFIPEEPIEMNAIAFVFNNELFNHTRGMFFGFQSELNVDGQNGYSALPFGTFPFMQNNSDGNIWTLANYQIYFQSAGSYDPEVYLYLSNGSYVQLVQGFSNFQLSIQPIEVVQAQQLNDLNLYLALAITIVGAVEIARTVVELLPKVFEKREENKPTTS